MSPDCPSSRSPFPNLSTNFNFATTSSFTRVCWLWLQLFRQSGSALVQLQDELMEGQDDLSSGHSARLPSAVKARVLNLTSSNKTSLILLLAFNNGNRYLLDCYDYTLWQNSNTSQGLLKTITPSRRCQGWRNFQNKLIGYCNSTRINDSTK